MRVSFNRLVPVLTALGLAAAIAPAHASAPAFYPDDQLVVIQQSSRQVGTSFTAIEVNVRNISDKTQTGPLRLSIETEGVVTSANGVDDNGVPFVNICRWQSCTLEPGQWSRRRTVWVRSTPRLEPSQIRITAQYQAFTTQVLHNADADGVAGALSNVSGFSALLREFRDEFPGRTLVLSSGDNYIPGPRYAAAADDSLAAVLGVPGVGRADIAFLNAMGYQASAVGNHELDGGTAAFAGIIGSEVDGGFYPGARFPYLSANLDFTTDANTAPLAAAPGLPSTQLANALTSSATVMIDGEPIGIIGATTPLLAEITSSGDIGIAPMDAGDLAALATEIQSAIDALTAAGIDKIILLSHMQQINIEKQLATLLRDVDVIIAGGSNSLLADSTDVLRVGDSAADDYPLRFANADGDLTLLVNTDGDYKYLGRLVAAFDLSGEIIEASLDEAVNGAYATDAAGLARAGNPAPVARVTEVADAVQEVLQATLGNIFGNTAVYLDGRRNQVRSQETNMGNLTADANLAEAKSIDANVAVSLKNGGGIRAPIGIEVIPPGSNDPNDVQFLPPAAIPGVKADGDISQSEIATTLRFNNGLTLVTVTAAELQALIEHGVSDDGAGDPELATPGKFPQVGGMKFSFDPAAPAGSRVQSLAVLDSSGAVADVVVRNGTLEGAADRTFRMVSLSFLVGGGDGYPFPDRDVVQLEQDENAPRTGAADFAADGTEQDALAEYLLEQFSSGSAFSEAEVPASEDERIQNLGLRADTVLN